ncbi:MAG: hypothetical protein NTZ01_03115, partial [Verrucomicrobia bacterium]|nr:hypothetical protein [Verrucomicrobiota bacterium]
RVGWIAALILGSMLEPYALGRQITLDMSLTFWVTAALACLVGIGTGVRGKFIGYLFFLCMGLGFLAKGPMAWVVPGAAAVMWCWAARKAGQKLSLPWKSGILLTLGVALSWFVGVCLKYPELWGYFLGYELVERFASTTHGRSKPWWFFLPILAMGTIPWTGFLPGLVVRAWEKMKGGALAPAQWALGAAVVIPFVVVSCSGSKLLTYILPIYAPLALALAIWLGGGSSGKWIRMGWFFALAVLLLFGPSLWLVRYLWVEAAAATPSSIYLIMGMVVGLGLVGGWWGGLRKAGLGWRVGVVGVGSLFVWHGACLQMERVNDLLGRQASVRPLARLAEKHMPERIFIYRARAAGFLFALNREAWINRADADVVVDPSSSAKERLFEKPEDLRRGLATGQKVEGITLRHVFRDEFDPTQWEIVGRAGEFFLVRAYGGGK